MVVAASGADFEKIIAVYDDADDDDVSGNLTQTSRVRTCEIDSVQVSKSEAEAPDRRFFCSLSSTSNNYEF